jgi:hypothetical protein
MIRKQGYLGLFATVATVVALAPSCADERSVFFRGHAEPPEVEDDDAQVLPGDPPDIGLISSFRIFNVGSLDFSGDFVYAVDVGRLGSSPGTIGDAVFTPEPTAGVKISAVNNFFPFGSPNFGSGTNNILESIMSDIDWSPNPSEVIVTLEDLERGRVYRLQLLFFEACCQRSFNVFVGGELVRSEFAPWKVGGNSTSAGAAGIAVEFTANDVELEIRLSGQGVSNANGTDHNPILDGFTLEAL